ncbi:unnamed protein product [Sphenostylis stenocarpa]|uniref:Uncharacterized protein n=1 Tax=Sphenostylis stenocarpa TaxID=92480 RepID=A0AA86SSQ6_9FABA|nr:unnamed protein product [Sphenostylis stenocarpa]
MGLGSRSLDFWLGLGFVVVKVGFKFTTIGMGFEVASVWVRFEVIGFELVLRFKFVGVEVEVRGLKSHGLGFKVVLLGFDFFELGFKLEFT